MVIPEDLLFREILRDLLRGHMAPPCAFEEDVIQYGNNIPAFCLTAGAYAASRPSAG